MALEDRYPLISPLKKAATTAILLIFFLLIISVLFVFTSQFFGWRTEIVISGSMEPAIPTGSVVVARPIHAEEVREGDVIMFASLTGHTLTTHRVVRVEQKSDGPHFTTKGDANKSPDLLAVVPSQILGIIVLSVPYLGYLISFIRTPIGIALFLVIPAAVLIISELLKVLKSQR